MKELERYRRNFLARHAAIGEALQRAVESAPNDKNVHQALAELHGKQSKILHPCIEAVLAQEGELPIFDVEAWREQSIAKKPSMDELLSTILAAHGQLTERISKLKPAEWSLQARHPWYGVRTLAWWLERNLEEMERVVARVILANSST
jgi:hypothetical protein